jgi:hypothetical protein
MKALRYLAIFTMIAWLAAQAFADVPKPAGTVEALEGQAEAKAGQDAPRKLAKGAAVFPADVITTPTGKDKAKIVFADGSALEIGPESAVAIREFAYDENDKEKSKQSIGLAKGIVRFVTGKVVAQNPDNLKIESPLALVGIRGTTTDHWIKYKPGTNEIESELHALRETKTQTEVIVETDTQKLVLNKPDQVAWVRPKLPGAVRSLTDDEKQSFGRAPITRSPFDPPARSFIGGAN